MPTLWPAWSHMWKIPFTINPSPKTHIFLISIFILLPFLIVISSIVLVFQKLPRNDKPLYFRCTFIYGSGPGITIESLYLEVLEIAVPTMDLHREIGTLVRQFRSKKLCHGGLFCERHVMVFSPCSGQGK